MTHTDFIRKLVRVIEPDPAKIALLTEGQKARSYAELISKAFRIAQSITQAGITEEQLVGIGITKSEDYIAAMIGTWIAGAAFVPLDPALPKERAQFIINQSGMCAILVKQTEGSVFRGLGINLIKVDDDWSDSSDETLERLAEDEFDPIAAERLAYVIYTSGSTGRPKGVMVNHSGIVNFLDAQIEAFRIKKESRCLFFLSTNFDASVSDIGTALLQGATLLIEPQGLLQPGPHFAPLIKERQITHMDVPPSLLRTMNVEEMPDSLETIIIGGEACAPDIVRRWAEKFLVVNVYGPTETTVCSSLGACDPKTWDRPLIGQPLPNTEYYLFDENMKEVNSNIPAELYIGGIAVARGYINEPELTAKKFIEYNGKRLYRTGDLVMRCDDGEIQFLGRVDRQFKLRGMLVEPEEIESKIAQHPNVAKVAVLKRPLREGFAGEKLVAFIQLHPEKEIEPSEIKHILTKSLPPWMVPQIFEFTENLPLTLTGKVDLTALRTIPLKSAIHTLKNNTQESGSKTRTEKILIEVWQTVFGVEGVSIHDDFYALGGDSLNVVEAVVAGHVRGLIFSPDLLAAHPTIAELAEAIENNNSGNALLSSETSNDNVLSSQFLRSDINSMAETSKSEMDVGPNNALETSPRKILLTGATGFLGARLLEELLFRTDAHLYCLVRASNGAAAMERIQHAVLQHGSILRKEDLKRITPIIGDIEKPRLGLDSVIWSELSKSIDTIFHSAAVVNMVKDYYELRGANVGGTSEILRLCRTGRKKFLHYASTLSVFVATNRNTGVARETDHLERDCDVYGGYAQTKFAAELVLRNADLSAGPISFYRLGLLTGDSKTGRSAKDDFLLMFARGISTLSCVPESKSEIKVDVTPVDFAASAMSEIALQDMKAGRNNTYHVANETSLSLEELVDAIRAVGFKIETLPANNFLDAIKEKTAKLNAAESAALLALCRTLGSKESFQSFRTMDLFQATDIKFDCTNTKKSLQETDIRCPSPSSELIERYLRRVL